MNKKKITIISILTAIIVAIIVIYSMVSIHYKKVFYPNTVINGYDCSGKDIKYIKNLLNQEYESYNLNVIGIDDSEIINGGIINLIITDDVEEKINNIFNEQNETNLLWIFNAFGTHNYNIDVTTTYNKKKLKKIVKNLYSDTEEIKSENAFPYYSETLGKYEIKKEIQGNIINKKKALVLIKNAIDNLDKEVDITDCYFKPEIISTNKELVKFVNKVNNYLNVQLTYDFDDRKEEITSNLIYSWLNIDENNLTVSLNSNKIREYVDNLGRTYDTYGRSRDFTTHSGKKIKISGGSYGWVINRPDTTTDLINKIENGENGLIEPIYSFSVLIRNSNDIGNSYVEISLSEQHVWVYIDGELKVDTDCVTGNVSRGYGTPTGIYPLNYKQRNATLKGETYASDVDYWMPFNLNIGMHDADWRSSFGGTIYKTSGSHGCINLPPSKAEQIYSLVYPNMPVIVYDLEKMD